MSREEKNKVVTTQLTSKKLKMEQIFIVLSFICATILFTYAGAREDQTIINISLGWGALTFVWYMINRFRVWFNHE